MLVKIVMKIFQKFFKGDQKLNANEIALNIENGKYKTLDKCIGNLEDLNTNDKSSAVNAINEIVNFYEKTDNGFVLKFSNGFMIEQKTVAFSEKSFTKDNSLYSASFDMGNWDVPFKTLLNTTHSTQANGARALIITNSNYQKGPTITYVGEYLLYMTWQGASAPIITVTGFGLWK